MQEPAQQFCDNNHERAAMVRVWSDPKGNSVYQCPVCGRKLPVSRDGRQS